MKLIWKIGRSETSTRRTGATVALGILLVGGLLLARLSPLAADAGDKTGWSVLTDPRKRAFLIFVPTDGASRLLNIACLRDVDSLSVISEGVAGALPSGAAMLTVSNGNARYDIAGRIAPDPISTLPTLTFTGDVAEDAKTLSGIAAKLLPVLQGSGPILYAISAGSTPPDLSKNPMSIPVAGLAAPLTKFKSICFGK